ncbi:AAEL009095-PA [Aedes aegypti]|uniref:AAEL009095-PA n=1 Tax=Aedes aegypti TaxID=7159 RepID=Q16WU3_AEDAE|nr:AAEL009095-PA [Aedes aegypti]
MKPAIPKEVWWLISIICPWIDLGISGDARKRDPASRLSAIPIDLQQLARCNDVSF